MTETTQADRLIIGLPAKGRLKEELEPILKIAGYSVDRRDGLDNYLDPVSGIEFMFLRSAEILQALARDGIQYAFLGQDVLQEAGFADQVDEILPLGIGQCALRVLARQEDQIISVKDLRDKRVITSYPNLTQTWVKEVGAWPRSITPVEGKLELQLSRPEIFGADIGTDVVQTGRTAARYKLEVLWEIFRSECALVGRFREGDPRQSDFDFFLKNLEAVLFARDYSLLKYNIPREKLEQAIGITPGVDGPTVTELANGWCVVEALVPTDQLARAEKSLLQLGADAILIMRPDKIIMQKKYRPPQK